MQKKFTFNLNDDDFEVLVFIHVPTMASDLVFTRDGEFNDDTLIELALKEKKKAYVLFVCEDDESYSRLRDPIYRLLLFQNNNFLMENGFSSTIFQTVRSNVNDGIDEIIKTHYKTKQ